jgi:hypothetical protein
MSDQKDNNSIFTQSNNIKDEDRLEELEEIEESEESEDLDNDDHSDMSIADSESNFPKRPYYDKILNKKKKYEERIKSIKNTQGYENNKKLMTKLKVDTKNLESAIKRIKKIEAIPLEQIKSEFDPNRGKIIKRVITLIPISKEKLLEKKTRYERQIAKINEINEINLHDKIDKKLIDKRKRIQKNLDRVLRKLKKREDKDEVEADEQTESVLNKATDTVGTVVVKSVIEPVKIGGSYIKNPTFIKNTTDPLTGKFVKSIYAKKITKLDRIKYDMVWQYYRDRNRQSVQDILKVYVGRDVQITYFGESEIKEITVPTFTEGKVTVETFTEGIISEGTISEGKVSEGKLTEGKLTDGKLTEGKLTEGKLTEGKDLKRLVE